MHVQDYSEAFRIFAVVKDLVSPLRRKEVKEVEEIYTGLVLHLV
jgi:hypothetical protein